MDHDRQAVDQPVIGQAPLSVCDGIDVETIVSLIRVADKTETIRLIHAALMIAFSNGVITGTQSMANIVDDAFAKAEGR